MGLEHFKVTSGVPERVGGIKICDMTFTHSVPANSQGYFAQTLNDSPIPVGATIIAVSVWCEQMSATSGLVANAMFNANNPNTVYIAYKSNTAFDNASFKLIISYIG